MMTRLILALGIIFAASVANAADTPKLSVFVHARCDGKLSSALIASLKDALAASPKYHLVPNLSDEGRLGEVHTLSVVCTERADVAAIATTYGKAKCFAGSYCHGADDGSSLKSVLCDASAAAECGRAIFQGFDEYVNSPNSPQLRLE